MGKGGKRRGRKEKKRAKQSKRYTSVAAKKTNQGNGKGRRLERGGRER
jgi:hypothetical protein